jgi:hypothetical protein
MAGGWSKFVVVRRGPSWWILRILSCTPDQLSDRSGVVAGRQLECPGPPVDTQSRHPSVTKLRTLSEPLNHPTGSPRKRLGPSSFLGGTSCVLMRTGVAAVASCDWNPRHTRCDIPSWRCALGFVPDDGRSLRPWMRDGCGCSGKSWTGTKHSNGEHQR